MADNAERVSKLYKKRSSLGMAWRQLRRNKGAIIGMILLFLCLFFKLIKPGMVKDAATVITKNMAVFFVPPAVGLMAYAEVISKSIWAIALAIIVSTVLTIIVVALVQEHMEKRQKSKRVDE